MRTQSSDHYGPQGGLSVRTYICVRGADRIRNDRSLFRSVLINAACEGRTMYAGTTAARSEAF
eukprot:3913930-Amphidinium_carterae.1